METADGSTDKQQQQYALPSSKGGTMIDVSEILIVLFRKGSTLN
jgi:hypothetical protein